MPDSHQHTDLKPLERKALRLIQRSLVHQGRSPSVRDLMMEMNYSSPRSAARIIESLIEKGYLCRKPDKSLQLLKPADELVKGENTIDIPLVGVASCGLPLLAEENVEARLPVSTALAPNAKAYFLLRASGDSMNAAGIEDGSIVLVRQQQTAETGDIVVALIDDEATIKELRRSKDAVALVPKSKNHEHKPIILQRDFQIQGIVVATLPDLDNDHEQ